MISYILSGWNFFQKNARRTPYKRGRGNRGYVILKYCFQLLFVTMNTKTKPDLDIKISYFFRSSRRFQLAINSWPAIIVVYLVHLLNTNGYGANYLSDSIEFKTAFMGKVHIRRWDKNSKIVSCPPVYSARS